MLFRSDLVDDEIKALPAISEVKQIGTALPALKGCYFFCKGNGLKKVRDKRVGLVYSIRHPCHRMLAYYPVATDGRSYLRRLYDFVCIPYYRILPYHALFRTEESAQTKFPELLIRHRLHRYVQIRYS